MTSDLSSAIAAFLLVLVLAPLVPGIATRTRAMLTGRRGAPVWQLYVDLRKLLGRGVVYSRTTTQAFRLVPLVGLAGLVAGCAD